MSIDLSALVLGPCMEAWAKPVTITPVKSQPTARPYDVRGVWTVDNINLVADNGAPFSTRTIKLGVKLDEFAVPLMQGDYVRTLASNLPMGYLKDAYAPGAVVDFVVDNDQPDGQGGTVLILKRKP
ncbi:head-tail joining protein [Bradyrhizobium japonicum]|uniref:head-tail joining protein n=1 Tax=Bradyrhizobium japonicum TaxID=375 RepID=UPI00055571F3|nr:hypothetical protein [Bradyrhizobium japonicum]